MENYNRIYYLILYPHSTINNNTIINIIIAAPANNNMNVIIIIFTTTYIYIKYCTYMAYCILIFNKAQKQILHIYIYTLHILN